ncbi:uncharacterized protein BX663DRAFT_433542 [Cokeromyces recurvatus]|uniref:uncharacterized protein n=1 Tax=Cokeromyces recurvatus TaxID=90255 RepID=UPI00221FA328|nr:uncharacterized protein BX663DRAFT_433542 [Cokeromyces recurvatus]KAI7903750.1 hypothetical protein BX663DRAFT_433542 [Cokeromyces recurvatus]
MLQPWALAAQIVFFTNSSITLKDWLSKLIKISTFQDDTPTTETDMEIRLNGLKKMIRGIIKTAFMKVVLDSLLPDNIASLLAIPFYKPKACFITFILALRIYCMISVVDIITGVIQTIFLIRFNDIFNNPLLATSPKDFWK